MSNPYKIDGPAQISFSGGRSSGMMLCKIVEAHGGTLPADVIPVFANTGKEHEETLCFVQKCGQELGIDIHWVEFRPIAGPQENRWATVTFANASRNGEPFADMVERDRYLPNPMTRTCTQHLKIKPMEGLMRRLGFEDYACVSGIRADEPRRIAKMRARTDVDFLLPLADAGVTKADVRAFWDAMPFDLGLPTINGETVHGNCDLCYLKGADKIISLIRERPESADWWIERETHAANNYVTKQSGGNWQFRIDRPNYAALKIIALQPQLDFGQITEDSLPCECVD